MTLGDIQNSIYRRTKTNSTSFTNADMLLAINRAYEKVNALMRKWIDNYRPTLFTSGELTTGTETPVFDDLYHSLIDLWASYEYGVENGLPNTNGWMLEIRDMERSLTEFYGMRNYFTFAVTIASPGVLTKDSHGLVAGNRISFVTTGLLPTGISADTFYYVVSNGIGANVFEVSATENGTPIDTSGSQSGTHYYFNEKPQRMGISLSDSNK